MGNEFVLDWRCSRFCQCFSVVLDFSGPNTAAIKSCNGQSVRMTIVKFWTLRVSVDICGNGPTVSLCV